MNNRPLYENLDTVFVNLSALVKYLRQREFVGRIRVELNNYEAEIFLLDYGKIGVREHDKISGRKSEGEEVFQRLLIRAREPGGTIHVYQTVAETNDEKVVHGNGNGNGNGHKPLEAMAAPFQNGTNGAAAKTAPAVENSSESTAHHPKFPFDLSSRMETRARLTQLPNRDWDTLLVLTGELLELVDNSLADAKLDFKLAFSKARSEISADYPFLHPAAKIFEFDAGKIVMHEPAVPKLFVAGIVESLRRILEKLGSNPKFTGIHCAVTHKMLALINQRQAYYDQYAMTPQLKKILGK